MKKMILVVLCLVSLASCSNNAENKKLQAQVNSLEKKLSGTYKPGFGEFMSGIQVHHAKLWFAGINNNWELAGFEIHEIMEALDNLKKFQEERKETRSLTMLNPALDSITNSILKKDPLQFRSSFVLLTAACNNCHKEVDYPFNNVKIPDTPPFSNQSFKNR